MSATSQEAPTGGAPAAPQDAAGATDAEVISQLRQENEELRASLLRWRVAAVSKWADTAAEAMETVSEIKKLKRQLHDSETDRLEIAVRHHDLNQLHHQLNERYLKMSRRYGNLNRISDLTGAGIKRRINRVVHPGSGS